MNNKKRFLAAALLTGSMMANAQSIEYKKITDDPDDYKRSMLYIDLFSADYYLEPTIGSALKFETMIGDRIMPWAQLKFTWLDAATTHAVSGYPTNEGGQKKQQIIDIGGALFFSKKDVNKRVKVVLSSHSSGNTTHTRYIRIPATVRRLIGVEGGIYENRKALGFDEKSHEFYRYESKDGLTNVPIENVGASSGVQPSGEAYKPLSMTNIYSIYGGLHMRKVTNVTIRTSSDGWKSNRTTADWYVDVMLAPSVSIQNVIDNNNKEWKIVPQSGAIKHLGWRAGYTRHNCSKVAMSYNFEFGQKPGPVLGKDFMSNGSFISLSLGLTVGSNKYVHLGGKKHKKNDAPATPSAPNNAPAGK